MFKRCVICNKIIFNFVGCYCKKCNKYKDTIWAKDLARIEQHNSYIERERKKFGEINFTKAGLDIHGDYNRH
jgi:hypothetical protein